MKGQARAWWLPRVGCIRGGLRMGLSRWMVPRASSCCPLPCCSPVSCNDLISAFPTLGLLSHREGFPEISQCLPDTAEMVHAASEVHFHPISKWIAPQASSCCPCCSPVSCNDLISAFPTLGLLSQQEGFPLEFLLQSTMPPRHCRLRMHLYISPFMSCCRGHQH